MSHWCHCQVNVMASLKWQESLMAVASCSTVSMSDLRYCCFIRPKPPSTKHLVWPTRMNSKLMSLFRPTTFRQERYAVTVRFLFWPQQLSACSPKYGAPSELFFQMEMEHGDDVVRAVCLAAVFSDRLMLIKDVVNLLGNRFSCDAK